jgi:hypothetical protein
MLSLSGRVRRAVGLLGAAGAAVQSIYLLALATVLTEDNPIDVEFVGFLAGGAVFFAAVAVLAFMAGAGRTPWYTRALFLALTPLVLFLFFVSIAAWGEVRDWVDTVLNVAFNFAEGAMLLALPALAVTRSRPDEQ